MADGPAIRYTTAPERYDGFGTTTLEVEAGRDFRGQVLRKVAIPADHLAWQYGRYASGCHCCASAEDVAKCPALYRLREDP